MSAVVTKFRIGWYRYIGEKLVGQHHDSRESLSTSLDPYLLKRFSDIAKKGVVVQPVDISYFESVNLKDRDATRRDYPSIEEDAAPQALTVEARAVPITFLGKVVEKRVGGSRIDDSLLIVKEKGNSHP